MTTETIRTNQTILTKDGNVTVLTAPPLLSYPPSRSKQSAPMLPLPSIGNQRKGDGWPDWASNTVPHHLIHRNYNADFRPPSGWPPSLEWRPPYGSMTRNQHPARNPKFDPRSMLWWSQWEIVFAKKVLELSDAETCSLFRFRWQALDRSTRYMQPYHVAEIMAILSDGHPWHAHAFRPGDPRPKRELCEEFSQDLWMAKQWEESLQY